MPKRRDSRAWQYGLVVAGVVAAVAVVVVALLTGHAERESPYEVDCATVKCVALTFDDGPTGCCRYCRTTTRRRRSS